MPNARLIIENTHLEFLGTSILICMNGEVIMNNCEIRSCYVGIQVQSLYTKKKNLYNILKSFEIFLMNIYLSFQLSDDSSLTANKCIFDSCLEHAIQMETERNITDETKYFCFNQQPNNISEIVLNECHCTKSDIEDIVLKPKRVTPVAEWLSVDPKI